MEAQYKTTNGRLTFKVDGDQKVLFKQVAMIQEIFDAESECGICKSKEIRFRTREVEGNTYYELICTGCGANFSFGQHKQGGTLFPKRKGEDGKPLPNGGWSKWVGKPSGKTTES